MVLRFALPEDSWAEVLGPAAGSPETVGAAVDIEGLGDLDGELLLLSFFVYSLFFLGESGEAVFMGFMTFLSEFCKQNTSKIC